MSTGSLRLLIVAALLVALGACGLKDDLFLPEPRAEQPTATGSGTTEQDEDDEQKPRPAPASPTP